MSGEIAVVFRTTKKNRVFPAEDADHAMLEGSSSAQDRDQTSGDSTGKSSDSSKRAAKSAAVHADLAELSASWNNLPTMLKSAILAIVRQYRQRLSSEGVQ
jgi:hypothetical protein